MDNHVLNYPLFLIAGIGLGILIGKFLLAKACFFDKDNGNIKDFTIPPKEASELINNYHNQLEDKKLKIKTSQGEENIKAFIIEAKVLYNLKDIAGNSFQGIALNLALNDNSTTLVVSALVPGASTKYKHLIPSQDEPRRNEYFYDHINICPDMCPANHASMLTMT